MDAKRAVQQLERWHYIGQPTHHGRRVDPFRIAGVPMETFWGEHQHPERIPELEAAIDTTCRPSTVTQTLAVIDGHDERILQHLVGGGRSSRAPAPPPARGEPTPISDQPVPLDDVDESSAEPTPETPLLGGVTIKRRRRGIHPASDVADTAPPVSASPAEPATLPISPPPESADAAASGPRQHELVEPAPIRPDGNAAGPNEDDGATDAGARRLMPMRGTLTGPGTSPLLDSLQEDRKRLQRSRERRND